MTASATKNSKRDFRFGVVFTDLVDAEQWPTFARRVEDAGFSTLLVADHFVNPMACTPLLATAAAATTTLRVGSYVYDNDFRHPALLAKEAATIDVLSGGRFELGIGAGWAKEEYDQVGLTFDPPGIRRRRLEEAVPLIRRLLAGETVTHHGADYHLDGLEGTPRPVQPRLPLLIGGGGERMIKFAADAADIVGLVPRSLPEGRLDPLDFSPAGMDAKIRFLEEGVEASARDDGGPERSALLFGVIPNLENASKQDWMPPEVVGISPHILHGDASQMCDALEERRERWGLTYFVCFSGHFDRLAVVAEKMSG